MAELKCVMCGKPRLEAYRPFCSSRCKQLDLHRWLSGTYAIAAVENEQKTEETSMLENQQNGDDAEEK